MSRPKSVCARLLRLVIVAALLLAQSPIVAQAGSLPPPSFLFPEGRWVNAETPFVAWTSFETWDAGYSYVVDQLPDTLPDTVVDTTNSWLVPTLSAEGDWYVHVRAVSEWGIWSPPIHKLISLDLTPPVLDSVECLSHEAMVRSDVAQVTFGVDAHDPWGSGVSHLEYEFRSYDSPYALFKSRGTWSIGDTYVTDPLSDGVWFGRVTALDAAGNSVGRDVEALLIDATPVEVRGITSQSHPDSEVAYASRTVDFTWGSDIGPVVAEEYVDDFRAINELEADGGHIFAVGELGLGIFAITDSPTPPAVSYFGFAWEPTGIEVQDGVAFLSGDGLVAVDVSDPASPSMLDALPIGWATDVCVIGDYAYVSGVGAITVVDVSSPGNLREVSSMQVGAADCLLGDEHLLYSVIYDESSGRSLHVIDISDPEAPQSVGSLPLGFLGYDIELVRPDLVAIAGGRSGLHVVDVSEPTEPEAVWHEFLENVSSWSVHSSDDYVFSGATEGSDGPGTLIWDFSIPTSPTPVQHIRPPASAFCESDGRVFTGWASISELELSSAIGYSYILDADPGTIPDETVDTIEPCATITDVPDGDWYMHVRGVDKHGVWGETSSLRVRVATREVVELSVYAGAPGSMLTVIGTGFGSERLDGYVTFGGTPATEYASWCETSVTCVVPEGANAGYVGVVCDGVASNGLYFVPAEPPAVTSMSPSDAAPGTIVSIRGSGFGDVQGPGYPVFSGIRAEVLDWSDTEVQAVVPSGISPGYAGVVQNGIVSNGMYFVPSGLPAIGALSSDYVSAGATVAVMGQDFRETTGTLTISGTPVEPLSWSDTRVTFRANGLLPWGYVGITQDGRTSNGKWLTIAPRVDAVSSWWTSVGETITVTGEGFGADGVGSVVVAGHDAEVLDWQPGRVVARVTAECTSGYVGVVREWATSNGVWLTVTEQARIDSVDRIVASPGETITITGSEFGDSQNGNWVAIGGRYVCETLLWSDDRIVAWVPVGASSGYVGVYKQGVPSNGVWLNVVGTDMRGQVLDAQKSLAFAAMRLRL